MKVLHVISSLGIGGAERLISDMLPQMKATEVDVSLLVYRRLYNDFEKKLEDAGVNIISLEVKSNYNPRIVFSLVNAIKGFDVIHVHLFPALYQVALANTFVHKRLIYTEHSTTNKRRNKIVFRNLERIVYEKYSSIVSVSNDVQKSLMRWLNIHDHRFIVIRNGIDLKSYIIPPQKGDYPVNLLMISRFVPAKDQETVIRAMQWTDKKTHVVFVGDGETRKSCEELARKIGVAERCHFEGTQSDIPYYISKADVGILSSHWEGFGLTAVEMMAGELPVVASDVEGLRQVIGGAGVLFKEGDDHELANNINKLIDNKEYYDSIVSLCQKRACLYDIRSTVSEYVKLYSDFL